MIENDKNTDLISNQKSKQTRQDALYFLAKPGKIALCSRKNKTELENELKLFAGAVIYSRADYWEMILKNKLASLDLFYSKSK